MDFIAHRGASYDAPENTLAAVGLAWQQNADAVEVDIHLSLDGKIVVIHDNTTGRTAGKDKPVAAQTLAELKALDAGQWKGEKWAGQKIPTLDEVLSTVPQGKGLFIEIKCGPEVVPALERLVSASGLKLDQTVFVSFDLHAVQVAKKAMPDCPVLLVAGTEKCKLSQWASTVKQIIDNAGETKLDGLDLQACDAIDQALVKQVKAAGLSLYVWTVDEPVLAEKMIQAGVDGITSNRQQWLRQQLGLEK